MMTIHPSELKVIGWCASQFSPTAMNSHEDYVQAGTEALIRAKSKYKEKKGSPETFAKTVVMNALRNYTRSDRRHDLPAKAPIDNLSCKKPSVFNELLPKLTPDEQYILECRLANWTNSEIAQSSGVNTLSINAQFNFLCQKIRNANE